MKRTQTSKANHLSKNGVIIADDTIRHSISECRQKQQDNQNKPQKYKRTKINHSINT